MVENDVGDKTPPNAPDYHEDLAFPPEEVKWTPPTSDIVELQERLKKTQELELQIRRENAKLNAKLKEWRKLAYDAKPIIIAHQNNAKILAQTLLKVSPEHREWLEVNFKEYL